MQSTPIIYDDFLNVDIRVGTIVQIDVFQEARKPAYKLVIDFGPEMGLKRSSAQITSHSLQKDELIGKQVLAVINFLPKQIGPLVSEVLTLGVTRENGQVILVPPGANTLKESRLH